MVSYVAHIRSRSSQPRRKQLPEDVRALIKSEKDLIHLLVMCEPLNNDQLIVLLDLAEYTPFNQVRVQLLER